MGAALQPPPTAAVAGVAGSNGGGVAPVAVQAAGVGVGVGVGGGGDPAAVKMGLIANNNNCSNNKSQQGKKEQNGAGQVWDYISVSQLNGLEITFGSDFFLNLRMYSLFKKVFVPFSFLYYFMHVTI